MPQSPRPLRIAIVNDYDIVVRGVAAMLSGYGDRVEVVELDNRLPVVAEVDVILFDTFGFVSGLGPGLQDLVRPGGPQVVVFSWTRSPHAVRAAMGQGAAGCLSKAMTAGELVDALEDIHDGKVAAAAEEEATSEPHWGDWPGREHELSHRESEVLALIAQGLTNDEIADALYLSVNTVKCYVRTAYRKIHARRRSQAVAWALDHGFALEPKRTFPDE